MSYKKHITSIISIIISISCLYLFYREVHSFNVFFSQIQNTKYLYILIATILLCITVFFRSLRWNILLGGDRNLHSLFKIQMIGYFGNNILPFRAGEILKSYLIGEKDNISKSYALGTVIIERFLDMVMLLFFAMVCFFISPIYKIGNIPLYYLLVIILITIVLFILFFVALSKFFGKIHIVELFFEKLSEVYKSLTFTQFFYANIYGVIIWLIYWINVILIFEAFNISIEFYQSLIILVVASVINSIPSLPGALGTFHLGVGITITGLNIVESNSIESLTTVLHLYGYLSLTIIGLYYFMIDRTVGIGQIGKILKD